MTETILIDDKKAFIKKYKLVRVGAEKSTFRIAVPKDAVQRGARQLEINEEQIVEKMRGVWRYNGFKGLYLDFEVQKEEQPDA